MIFTLVTNKENPEINPLIKNVYYYFAPSPADTGLYIYDSFVLAIECGENANYLNDEIRKNVWWSESIDDTIASILKKMLDEFTIKPIFSDSFLENCTHIEYKTESTVVLIPDISIKTIKIFDKRIGGYFSGEIKHKNTYTYENKFRKLLKCCGLVEKEYTILYIASYLKRIIGKEYALYVAMIFRISLPVMELEKKLDESGVWDNLFLAENYFNDIQIYNLEQSPKYDFNFKKDEDGNYYVQYEYNASESLTGRMFPTNLQTYQPLQTLPKEDRYLLKAEKNCTLIEYDYKNFELKIIYDTFKNENYSDTVTQIITMPEDPHKEICELLKIDPIKNRSFGKSINYAIVYGMSVEHLVDMILEKFNLDKFFVCNTITSYPFYEISKTLKQKIKNKIVDINNKKLIYTITGRLIKFEKEHAVLNNYIQSIASDILYKKIKDILEIFHINKLSKKNKIILQNHDSLLLQIENSVIIKTDIVEQINKVMQEAMFCFSPKVEFKSGTNWGELK